MSGIRDNTTTDLGVQSNDLLTPGTLSDSSINRQQNTGVKSSSPVTTGIKFSREINMWNN